MWEAGAVGEEALARPVSFLHRLPTTLRDFSELPFHLAADMLVVSSIMLYETIYIYTVQIVTKKIPNDTMTVSCFRHKFSVSSVLT